MSASTIYLRDMNTYIDDTQDKLNQELFSGIKEISVSLNSTIVEFLDKLNETLSDIFGSTPLAGSNKHGCLLYNWKKTRKG